MGSGTNRDRRLSRHVNPSYDNSENAIYLLLKRKVNCKNQRPPGFCVLALSLMHPDTIPEEVHFSWVFSGPPHQNLIIFFFQGAGFIGVLLVLFTRMSQEKKLFIKAFLPFASDCDWLPGYVRGSLWEWQLSNNSILNTSLFYGLCLETTSLHCRFY